MFEIRRADGTTAEPSRPGRHGLFSRFPFRDLGPGDRFVVPATDAGAQPSPTSVSRTPKVTRAACWFRARTGVRLRTMRLPDRSVLVERVE